MSENVVWNSTLDGRYTLTVVRTGPNRAELSIHDEAKSFTARAWGWRTTRSLDRMRTTFTDGKR
jgi:hypothetical protein